MFRMTSAPTRGATGPTTRAGAVAGPACADDPEVMFPLQESTAAGQRTRGELAALAVCRRCPVAGACRSAVLDTLESAPMTTGVAGGLTREDRRVLRAAHRGLTPHPAVAAAAAAPTARVPDAARSSTSTAHRQDTPTDPAPVVVVDVVDEAVAAAIAAHPQVARAVDSATVRALVTAHGPEWASRWETALAATALLALGVSMTAAARLLGEEQIQVKRWRDRAATGTALVSAQGGTRPLRRARAVGPQTPALPAARARARGRARVGSAA